MTLKLVHSQGAPAAARPVRQLVPSVHEALNNILQSTQTAEDVRRVKLAIERGELNISPHEKRAFVGRLRELGEELFIDRIPQLREEALWLAAEEA